ncbi:MAG: fumarylacetoacetate hydrolase family protein [Cryobacterium sp.]|nr:fumarylacetoacetate hydrolase family protein [Cryobacterium sp.]
MNTVPDAELDRLVDILMDAERTRRDLGRLTTDRPWLDATVAYRAQARQRERRLDAGDQWVGTKLGLTSRAKQQRMGISSPLTGFLAASMALPLGAPIPFAKLIHPRVEPEIVFVMKSRLVGPGVTAATALAAVESVHAGLEVIDSRYTDFDFALADVIADNASSARFAVSPTGVSPVGLDLQLEACVLRLNGEVVDTATGAAVQGNPFEALALAANDLGARGEAIEAGQLVLTGGLTDAIFIAPGDSVSVEFTSLGSLTITVAASEGTT